MKLFEQLADFLQVQRIAMTERRLAMLVAHLKACKVDADIDTLKIWIMATFEISNEDFARGIAAYWRSEQPYRHDPAALRVACGHHAPTVEDRAIDAWGVVHNSIGTHGGYRAVRFEDGFANEALFSMGGWVRLCNEESENMHWRQKEFVAAYCGAVRRGKVSMDIHPGLLPADKTGEPALLIGSDPKKAIEFKQPVPLRLAVEDVVKTA